MRANLRNILLADPMSRWAYDAIHAWDFTTNEARWNRRRLQSIKDTPGWTFTRASAAYYTNAAGVMSNFASGVPRIGDVGLLVEPGATNILTYSQQMDNAAWTKTNATISANATTAPDGTTTADKLEEDSVNTTHYTSQIPSASGGATYIVSVYAKAAERSHFLLYDEGVGTFFNLANGTITSDYSAPLAKGIEPLTNGWYRCWIAVTSTGATGPQIMVCNAATTYSYTGTTGYGIYIWGAQTEIASYTIPTSYIPTTTASAARVYDSPTVASGLGGSYPLSLFCEFPMLHDINVTQHPFLVQASDYTESSLFLLGGGPGARVLYDTMIAGGATQAQTSVTGAIAVNTVVKGAARFQLDNTNIARAGILATNDTSCTAPATATQVTFGLAVGSATAVAPTLIRRAAIFNRALTDVELQRYST